VTQREKPKVTESWHFRASEARSMQRPDLRYRNQHGQPYVRLPPSHGIFYRDNLSRDDLDGR